MLPTKLVASQLLKPSGLVGKVILPRVFNRRNVALNDLTLESLALAAEDRVLELGFGGGYLLGRMSAVVTLGLIAGVDSSPLMAAFCARQYRSLVRAGRLEIGCASAGALPYPSGFFSKACSVNTIFYFPDAPRAISELGRVLEEDGRLAICFTAKKYLENRKFARNGLTLYEAEEVQGLMELAGFSEIRMIPGSDRWREFLCAVGKKQGGLRGIR